MDGSDDPLGGPREPGTRPPRDATEALEILRDGELRIVGRIVGSSNSALVVTAVLPCPDPEPDRAATAVYKPIRLERPLVDFPDGSLAAREVASFVLSETSGWGISPPTVLRDGPVGRGMVQLWIDVDPSVDRVALALEGDARLRRMAIFDVIANNADRKIGHLLPVESGHVYGVDHGLTFHVEPKLRTVLWSWRGRRLEADELDEVEALRDALLGPAGDALRALLSATEVRETIRRTEGVLRSRRFPLPDPERPAIPWPPY